MCLNISLARNTASCIPPSDFLLEISQSQINLVDGKLALPAWRDGWLMSVLLPAPQTWQPESLSSTTSLSHLTSLPQPEIPSRCVHELPELSDSPGHCCDPRGPPVTSSAPLVSSGTALPPSTSSPALVCCCCCLVCWSQRSSPTSEFGSSGTSRHYHYHVVI